MGDRGRLVVPADVRDSQGWVEGTPLAVVDTPDGVLLMTKAQLIAHLRRQLDGHDLVAELLADRRAGVPAEAGR
jgi:AbrB family looped-hinge helix DNA binding protein